MTSGTDTSDPGAFQPPAQGAAIPADQLRSGVTGNRPEELPPVTPPSAGYIVQLFLIPALIVMAVVAVWALFGKLADSESDWTQLVSELGSANEHRRWRAALGLAQLLRNEELSPPSDRQPLSQHPEVINALTGLLQKSLMQTSPTEEDVTHQEFLARTLSALDADDVTLPVLAEAMKDSHPPDVRKSALMSVATIAGRHFDKATGYLADDGKTPVPLDQRNLPLMTPTLTNAAVREELKRCAQDPEPVIRHLASFAIASVGDEPSLEQLRLLLLDSDSFARANAAVGLARNGSTDGVPVLKELLDESNRPFDRTRVQGLSPAEQRLAENRFLVEQPQIARNCLRAIGDLWPRLDDSVRTELASSVKATAELSTATDVRLQAQQLLHTTIPVKE